MKSLFAYFFTVTFFMQPVTALSVDYSDFDSFCKTLRQYELKLIQKELEEGLLNVAEAEEEIDYIPEVEQCVCIFEKVLEGTGADFTLYMQKASEIEILDEIELVADANYTNEELGKMEMPKYPEGMDIVAFVSDSEKACGIDQE
ncbi:MAG: hypothetical protein V3U65_06655 [Granulosicoccaceae bacterium]